MLDVPRRTLQAWRAYQERLDESPAVVAFFHSVPGRAFLHRLVLAFPVVFVEVGAWGMRFVCLLLALTGLNRLVGASYGTQQRGNGRMAKAMGAYRHAASARLAHEMPAKDITLTQDATFPGGLSLVGIEPVRTSMLLAQAAQAREQDTWPALMAQALAGLNGRVMQSPSDEAPGRLAYVAHPLRAQHSPAVFHGPHALSQAVSGPIGTKPQAAQRVAEKAEEKRKQVQESRHNANDAPATRGPGRPPQAIASLEQVEQEVAGARQAPQRLAGQREQVTQRLRAIGHAYHCVDLDRGGRRTGKRIAGDLHAPIATIRSLAPQAGLSKTCMDRREKAERVVPKMQAPIAFVAGYVRPQVRQLAWASPVSYAMHAHLIPSCSIERVAATRTMTEGAPLRALAERLRTPLFAPGGAWGEVRPDAHNRLEHKAKTRAEVFQRSSSHVAGRNGDLSLRNHPLRGLDHPRKRACLTAMHNFFLTRADGTTAAERFVGQKPRSMFATILEAVALPPAPLRPLRQAVG